MRTRVVLPALALAGAMFFTGASNVQAAGFLYRVFNPCGCRVDIGCCDPAPTCCEVETTCCDAEPTCCDSDPCGDACCDPCCRRRPLRDFLRRVFSRRCGCDSCCETDCCEDSCGGCDSCGG
jgi:hypothetical protein